MTLNNSGLPLFQPIAIRTGSPYINPHVAGGTSKNLLLALEQSFQFGRLWPAWRQLNPTTLQWHSEMTNSNKKYGNIIKKRYAAFHNFSFRMTVTILFTPLRCWLSSKLDGNLIYSETYRYKKHIYKNHRGHGILPLSIDSRQHNTASVRLDLLVTQNITGEKKQTHQYIFFTKFIECKTKCLLQQICVIRQGPWA